MKDSEIRQAFELGDYGLVRDVDEFEALHIIHAVENLYIPTFVLKYWKKKFNFNDKELLPPLNCLLSSSYEVETVLDYCLETNDLKQFVQKFSYSIKMELSDINSSRYWRKIIDDDLYSDYLIECLIDNYITVNTNLAFVLELGEDYLIDLFQNITEFGKEENLIINCSDFFLNKYADYDFRNFLCIASKTDEEYLKKIDWDVEKIQMFIKYCSYDMITIEHVAKKYPELRKIIAKNIEQIEDYSYTQPDSFDRIVELVK